MRGGGRLIFWAVLAGAVVVLGVFSHAFLKAQKAKTKEDAPAAASVDSDIRLTDMDYTEVQEGKPLWRIKAKEAKYYEKEQKTLLSGVTLTLFMENNQEVHLAGDYGLFHTGRKDVELWGHVTARAPQGYELQTDRVLYEHSAQTIRSQSPVRFLGPQVDVAGTEGRYDLTTATISVEGEVRALVRGFLWKTTGGS